MKFRAHETFFIRKGWLSKGMQCVKENPRVFLSQDENPMDVFGIGANMVKALRYWLQAVGLTEEKNEGGKRIQVLTELGEIIFEYDTYIEELGTLDLLQYRLVSQKDEATAWYFFFNEFAMTEFTREDFIAALQKYAQMNNNGNAISYRSLNDDFQCIINTYLPRYKSKPVKISPENNIDCPLGELGLIDILNKNKKTYRKSTPATATLNPYIIFAVIQENGVGATEISLDKILNAPCNIGKIFNLDSSAMIDALYKIEKLHLIKIKRTAGLDVIVIKKPLTFLECVKLFYDSINAENVE